MAAIGLTIFLVIVVVIGALVTGDLSTTSTPSFGLTPGLIVGILFASELPFAGFAMFLRWRYRRKGHLLEPLFAGKFVSSIVTGAGVGLCLAVVGALNAALAVKLFGKASTQGMEEIMKSLASLKERPGMVAALVFSIAVLAPFCEEFFFRGAVFGSVRSTPQARAGVIVSTLLFAIAHVNPMMFPYYVVFGLTMCWLLSKTGTMAASIAAHMTVNALVCIAVLLAPTGVK
ncbi:MAG TPA: type II CAAX endopeptidase family protein [Terriglobia bacterium]|nr:type II CAAX endopeptidase family protein [Terriglobia bacterium]